MSHLSFRRILAVLAVFSLFAAACGDDEPAATDATATTVATDDSTPDGSTPDDSTPESTEPAEGEFTTRNVPADYPTIQDAVDAAGSGDLVLIAPGVYTEGVVVEKDNIVIRGVDRNETIIDGEFERENGFIIFGNGVAVENLTSRNNTANGVFWTGDYDLERILDGYRASYVNVVNNGNYGIYAFNAVNGQIDHTYGSGSPDSPYYIGQCNPCNAVLYDVIGENSQLGYSGTNSTGVTIVGSEFRNNIIGVVPNSQDGEELAPNAGTTIVGNYIHDNNSDNVPGNNDDFLLGHGTGVILVGVDNNIVERNLIVDNERFGVIILPWIFSGTRWDPHDNIVRDNVVTGSTIGADLVLALWDTNDGAMGNCFADNVYDTALPEELADIATCDVPSDLTGFEDIGAYIDAFAPGPPYVDYKTVPHADLTFDNMVDPETAPPVPAAEPMEINLDDFQIPEVP